MLEEEAEEEPFLGHGFLFGESHNSLAFWPKFIDPNRLRNAFNVAAAILQKCTSSSHFLLVSFCSLWVVWVCLSKSIEHHLSNSCLRSSKLCISQLLKLLCTKLPRNMLKITGKILRLWKHGILLHNQDIISWHLDRPYFNWNWKFLFSLYWCQQTKSLPYTGDNKLGI